MGRKKIVVFKWSSDGSYVSVVDRFGSELAQFDDSDEARDWCEDRDLKVIKET